ncbi:MAG: hypothetical protein E7813_15285 [Bradyrhizobium sp.]|uniref:hypothetical protein n=1 Tax=Bradyrhizobium sp. TaxID=376 RepID=UPI0011F846A4|nr:hypothetical protein [Bradyrhizobium sp.]THD65325.1 MAG: hypothetical protein E7813_15285 [Bradyrhizobium sp.]
MTKALFTAAMTLLFANGSAFAEPVSLICEGTFYNYASTTARSTVGPAAATLDIENTRFETPVGTFHILRTEETSISFDEPSASLVVYGTLDRLTGVVTASWTTLAENAKRKSLLPYKSQAYVELHCSPAKRLF